MIYELTTGIRDYLKLGGLDVNEISFKDMIDGTMNLQRPAINVIVNSSTAEKVTINCWKYRMTVSLLLIIQNLKGSVLGDEARKKAIYQLIETISDSLTLQNFSLELENPLIPMGFRNITTQTYAKAGYQLYQLQFWCSYNVAKSDPDADASAISEIVASYFIMPDAVTVQAQDNI